MIKTTKEIIAFNNQVYPWDSFDYSKLNSEYAKERWIKVEDIIKAIDNATIYANTNNNGIDKKNLKRLLEMGELTK